MNIANSRSTGTPNTIDRKLDKPVAATDAAATSGRKFVLQCLDGASAEIRDLKNRLWDDGAANGSMTAPENAIKPKSKSPYTETVEMEHLGLILSQNNVPATLVHSVKNAIEKVNQCIYFDNNEGGIEFIRYDKSLAEAKQSLTQALAILQIARTTCAATVAG